MFAFCVSGTLYKHMIDLDIDVFRIGRTSKKIKYLEGYGVADDHPDSGFHIFYEEEGVWLLATLLRKRVKDFWRNL